MKTIIGLLILSFFYIGCSQKIRDNRVEYKVTLVPYAGQTNYSTAVEYRDSDNTTKK